MPLPRPHRAEIVASARLVGQDGHVIEARMRVASNGNAYERVPSTDFRAAAAAAAWAASGFDAPNPNIRREDGFAVQRAPLPPSPRKMSQPVMGPKSPTASWALGERNSQEHVGRNEDKAGLRTRSLDVVRRPQQATRFSIQPYDFVTDLNATTKDGVRFSLPSVFTVVPDNSAGGNAPKKNSLRASASNRFRARCQEKKANDLIELGALAFMSSLTILEVLTDHEDCKRRMLRHLQGQLSPIGLRIFKVADGGANGQHMGNKGEKSVFRSSWNDLNNLAISPYSQCCCHRETSCFGGTPAHARLGKRERCARELGGGARRPRDPINPVQKDGLSLSLRELALVGIHIALNSPEGAILAANAGDISAARVVFYHVHSYSNMEERNNTVKHASNLRGLAGIYEGAWKSSRSGKAMPVAADAGMFGDGRLRCHWNGRRGGHAGAARISVADIARTTLGTGRDFYGHGWETSGALADCHGRDGSSPSGGHRNSLLKGRTANRFPPALTKLIASFCIAWGLGLPVALAQTIPEWLLYTVGGTSIAASACVPVLQPKEEPELKPFYITVYVVWGVTFAAFMALELILFQRQDQRRLLLGMVAFCGANLLSSLAEDASSTTETMKNWGPLALSVSLWIVPALIRFLGGRQVAHVAMGM